MTPARRGSIVGAVWLIGAGVVFLIQQSSGWSWGQAWPLWVILVGVGTFVDTLSTWRPGVAGIWAFTWPVAWIVVGILLLLSTTGQLGQGPSELISEFWPWAAVILGVWFLIGAFLPWGQQATEALVLPLNDTADAVVRIRFGAGELTNYTAEPGHLIDGTFDGGVTHRLSGPGRVELSQDTTYGLPWLDRRSQWDVGLPGEVRTGSSRRGRRQPHDTGPARPSGDEPAPADRGKRDAGPAAEIRRRDDRPSRDRRGVTHDRDPGRRGREDPQSDGARQHPDRRGAVPSGGRYLPVDRLRDGREPGRHGHPGRRRLGSGAQAAHRVATGALVRERHRLATVSPEWAACVPEPHPKRFRSGNDRSSIDS